MVLRFAAKEEIILQSISSQSFFGDQLVSGASGYVRITCLPTSVACAADKSGFSSFVACRCPRGFKTAPWDAAAFKEGLYHLCDYKHLFRGWILGLRFFGAPPGNLDFLFFLFAFMVPYALPKSHEYLSMLG